MSSSPHSKDSFASSLSQAHDYAIDQVILKYGDRVQIKKHHLLKNQLPIIFEKAVGIAVEDGFPSLNLRDLCKSTSLSMGGLYSYINNKDQLLEMILDYGSATIENIVLRSAQEHRSPRDRLESIITTHLLLAEHMQKWFYFVYRDVHFFPKRIRNKALKRAVAIESMFLECLEEGVKSNEFHTDMNLQVLASMIKSILQDWYMKRWKYKKRSISTTAYKIQLINLLNLALSTHKEAR